MHEYVNLGEHKFVFLYNLIMKMMKIHLDISGELRFIEFEYHVVSMVEIFNCVRNTHYKKIYHIYYNIFLPYKRFCLIGNW